MVPPACASWLLFLLLFFHMGSHANSEDEILRTDTTGVSSIATAPPPKAQGLAIAAPFSFRRWLHIRLLEGENPSNSVLAGCLVAGHSALLSWLAFPPPSPIAHRPSPSLLAPLLQVSRSLNRTKQPTIGLVGQQCLGTGNAATASNSLPGTPSSADRYPLRRISRSVDAK